MKLYLYRCPLCSSIKLFTEKQTEDFTGGLVCDVKTAYQDSCNTIMDRVYIGKSNSWGNIIISTEFLI